MPLTVSIPQTKHGIVVITRLSINFLIGAAVGLVVVVKQYRGNHAMVKSGVKSPFFRNNIGGNGGNRKSLVPFLLGLQFDVFKIPARDLILYVFQSIFRTHR